MIIGRNALYYEDYILALQYFNQVINSKPYLPEPYFFRAMTKYFLEDFKGAEDDCTLALKINPYMTRAYQLRGETRQRQKLYDLALEDYERALKNNPRDIFSGLNSTAIYLEKNKTDKASDRINDIITNSPKNTQAYLLRGAVSIAKGDTLKAYDDYNKAISIDKYFSRTYALKGMLQYMQNKLDSALVNLDHAIALEPLVLDYYINRGLIKYNLNDLRGAMSDYDHVINKNPNDLTALFNRGILRTQVHDINNAIDDFNTIINLQPNNYLAIYNRAILYKEIGEYSSALYDMNRIVEKYPDKISVYYARGSIFEKLGNNDKAQADYKKASQIEQLALKDTSKQVDKDYQIDYRELEKDDKDIDKFKSLLMAEDKTMQESKYKNDKRGNIQDKALNAQPENMIVISYYTKTDNYKTSIYPSKELDKLNDSNILPHRLYLTNMENALNQDGVDYHFNEINYLSSKLDKNTADANLYFIQALNYGLVQDFPNAEFNLNKSLQLDNKSLFALFELAVVKTKELELRKYGNENKTYTNQFEEKAASRTQRPISSDKFENATTKDNPNLEYDQIIRLYNQIVDLYPDFAYAYYNRALLEYNKGDFTAAVEDFTKSIELNNRLYEAYFNRGLSYFHLKNIDKGLEDMRMAGQGGIIEAYPIIKRMTE